MIPTRRCSLREAGGGPDRPLAMIKLDIKKAFDQLYRGKVAPAPMQIQRTLHRTHTRALFLAAHARTPDVFTHLAQGLDDLFVCLKNHSIIGHVFVECSFDPVSSYFLSTCYFTDDTCCLSCAIDWNQTKPVCNSARGWTARSSGRSDPKRRL